VRDAMERARRGATPVQPVAPVKWDGTAKD
jgi:hypothetical protein